VEFVVEHPNRIRAKWYSLGAVLAELHVPDRRGKLADVVLGFDAEAAYGSADNQHFGCTTGRYANRIARGRFAIDGTFYQLDCNLGENHLHGGSRQALDKVDWHGTPVENALGKGVCFRYLSPDGQEGYPGNLDVTVTYLLSASGSLRIDYAATTDRPTHVNLTNHSYFNLSGQGFPTVLHHVLRVDADRYTVADASNVPTGAFAQVEGTPLDFRLPTPLGERIGDPALRPANGYDHNLVLNGAAGSLRLIAELADPLSGRWMKTSTDQPGVQLYTGNFLRGQPGKAGRTYPGHSAVCLETQAFPDSPNRPHFPSTLLRPGESYRHACVYEFGAA